MSELRYEDILELLDLERGIGPDRFAPAHGTRDEFLARTLDLADLVQPAAPPVGAIAASEPRPLSTGARVAIIASLAAGILLTIGAVAFFWVRHDDGKQPEQQPVAGTRPVVEEGFLTVETTPQTVVYIDDEMAGTTPLSKHRVLAGRRVVRVENADAGISKIYKVKVLTGKDTTIVKDLEPVDAPEEQREIAEKPREKGGQGAVAPPKPKAGSPGWLNVQTKPWTTVYVDGKKIGSSPIVKYPLNPGSHKVSLKNPDKGISKSYKVAIKSGSTTTLVKSLENEPVSKKTPKGESAPSGPPGKLSVQTKPWSTVYIDGKKIKNTPLVNYSLKPGTYDVTVENPVQSISKTYRVKVLPGKTTTLVKTLD
jgi:hypothetical protein